MWWRGSCRALVAFPRCRSPLGCKPAGSPKKSCCWARTIGGPSPSCTSSPKTAPRGQSSPPRLRPRPTRRYLVEQWAAVAAGKESRRPQTRNLAGKCRPLIGRPPWLRRRPRKTQTAPTQFCREVIRASSLSSARTKRYTCQMNQLRAKHKVARRSQPWW